MNTLRCRVSPLVKLTGQRFHGKDDCAGQIDLSGCGVQLGLGEHGADSIVKQFLGDVFGIITVKECR